MTHKIIWLSYPLDSNTPAYGGGDGFHSEQRNSLEAGDSCNTAMWRFPNHTGTHVDAPNHFIVDGITVDSIDPSFWFFNSVCVVEIKKSLSEYTIKKEDVLPYINGEPDLLLIKTGMGDYRQERVYWENNPGLDLELGRVLKSSIPSLRAVGVDSISISSWQNRELGRKAHRAFLDPGDRERPLVLVEDMDLSQISVNSRISKVIILPLRVEGADGAPCTVVAEVDC